MSENFFKRWSRLKTENTPEPASPAVPTSSATDAIGSSRAGGQKPLPTLDDVARLTADSDYSAFVAKGVDQMVRRQALKKLFTDPHFNVMDGLDIYIDDYNRPSPLPASMLAALRQAQSFIPKDQKNQAESIAAAATASGDETGSPEQSGDEHAANTDSPPDESSV